MNRNRFWMLGAFILVSALLVGATLKTRQTPLYQLSHYPQTFAFNRYVLDVSSEMKTPSTDSIINISELEQGEGDLKNVLEYKVKADGQFDLNVRDFATGRGGQSRAAKLDSQQLAEVKKLIAQLPPSAPPTKREELLVVLIYQPSPIQLRLYDYRNPPRQIREIVGVLINIVEKQDNLIPAEQRPTSLGLPHLRSSLRPEHSSNSQDAVN